MEQNDGKDDMRHWDRIDLIADHYIANVMPLTEQTCEDRVRMAMFHLSDSLLLARSVIVDRARFERMRRVLEALATVSDGTSDCLRQVAELVIAPDLHPGDLDPLP